MALQSTFEFQWNSLLGIATGLFLFYGLFNVLLGILMPFVLHRAARNTLLVGPHSDTILLGQTPAELLSASPALGAVRYALVMWLAGLWVSFGILQLALAWYGLRMGQPWAFWTLVIGDLSILPFLALFLRPFLRHGISVLPRGLAAPPIFYFPAVIIPIAAVLGWLGLR